jgi:hypothetical protein
MGEKIMNTTGCRVWALIVSSAWLMVAGMARAQEAKPAENAAAKEPPANQWARIGETPQVGNVSLVYAPNVKRFVMVTPEGVRHFDLASNVWKSAPTPGKWPDIRLRKGTYFQVAWDPGSKKVVSYLRNRTWSLDPETWKLVDHKASPSPAAGPRDLLKERELGTYCGDHSYLIWGSLCVDPVNNEALLLGGASTAPEGTPGFWRYAFEKNVWTQDASASEDDRRRMEALKALEDGTWNLLSRARNRFHLTETDEEAKADLTEAAETVAQAIEKVRAAEKNERAAAKLEAAAAAVRKAILALGAKPDFAAINTLLAAHRGCSEAGHVAAPAPPARLNAPMAYDAAAKKIVLFGGDGWDRLYADTWVYDCATRRWEQRFPESAPEPRAGSALVYLPKSKKILLIGGYAYGGGGRGGHRPIADMWVYDTPANRWTRLAHAAVQRSREVYSAAGGFPLCGPTRGYHEVNVWPAAADENDNVVLVEAGNAPQGKRINNTWLCRVEPESAASAKQPEKAPPLAVYRNWMQGWDRHGPADREKQKKVMDGLEANVWTHLPTPRDTVHKCWGTTAYDTRRQQLLYWGGGHSGWMGADVHHWSLRGGLWSQSYDPEINLNFAYGFNAPGLLTFRNRPHTPVHGYQCYAYDPVADLMVATYWHYTFTYDPGRREWVGAPIRTSFKSGNVMQVSHVTTPHGVVIWADNGLFLFDGQARAWKKLPLSGNPGTPYCDRSGMCYDSKRDCLWLGGSSNSISKYDMKTGALARFTGCPKVLKDAKGRGPTIREMTYIADQDLVLFMLVKSKDGKPANYCFDPENGKWYWLELPYRAVTREGVRNVVPDLGRINGYWWDGGLSYDAEAKVAILSLRWVEMTRVRPAYDGRVWLLKLDRKTAKMTPIE